VVPINHHAVYLSKETAKRNSWGVNFVLVMRGAAIMPQFLKGCCKNTLNFEKIRLFGYLARGRDELVLLQGG
jgi:hypothetical protein